MRSLLAIGLLGFALLSGCVSPLPETPTVPPPPPPMPLPMTFATYGLPAVHQGHGLYEPTIDASPEGTLYLSAHSTGVGAGPAPGYYSTDGGKTWQTLAIAGSAATPSGQQGSAPLFSDEIFIVAGDGGTAWGVDINLRDYIVTGWCQNGAELCYYNPYAYDNTQLALQATDCAPAPLKDRPWAAYANGTLLLVNNPSGGPAQIGAMKVPPAAPLPADVGHVASGIQWNLCASSGGFIPGIPDIRPDGFFAVPQVNGKKIQVVTGNAADVMAVTEVTAMPHDTKSAPDSQIGDFGQAAFDADGTLFVVAMNNNKTGDGFQYAASTDDGKTFVLGKYVTEGPVTSVYVDGNRWGPGLLVNWGVANGTRDDWYFGHLFLEDGQFVMRNVNLAVPAGPQASRHVQGAALGPDGRAYMAMSEVSGNDEAAMAQAVGTMPMSVVAQTGGETMPVPLGPMPAGNATASR